VGVGNNLRGNRR